MTEKDKIDDAYKRLFSDFGLNLYIYILHSDIDIRNFDKLQLPDYTFENYVELIKEAFTVKVED